MHKLAREGSVLCNAQLGGSSNDAGRKRLLRINTLLPLNGAPKRQLPGKGRI